MPFNDQEDVCSGMIIKNLRLIKSKKLQMDCYIYSLSVEFLKHFQGIFYLTSPPKKICINSLYDEESE